MNSDNEKERVKVFESLTCALHKEKEIFATVLNQIGRLRNTKGNELEDREILASSFMRMVFQKLYYYKYGMRQKKT